MPERSELSSFSVAKNNNEISCLSIIRQWLSVNFRCPDVSGRDPDVLVPNLETGGQAQVVFRAEHGPPEHAASRPTEEQKEVSPIPKIYKYNPLLLEILYKCKELRLIFYV